MSQKRATSTPKRMGRPPRTALEGDPPWLEPLLEATQNGVALEAYVKREGTPDKSTVCRWLADREDILQRFARARRVAARTTLAHRIEETAEGPRLPDGTYDAEADTAVRVNRDRLKVETLKYLAGIYDPETFGDHRPAAAGNVTVQVVTGVPDSASEERRRLVVEATPPPRLTDSSDA